MPSHAQLGFDLKVDKPEPYEDRLLKAEKTKDKKLGGPRKFFQNLTTHYNYYFNANVKLNEVILGAKQNFRDDYTQLLPFYNYTLDATAENSRELDSVIYKAQTGIVMHDLRNDWIDNMYMLWGAAWFLEKKFDSAALMFQFINYSFAEKEKDGYYKYIGSRMDGNNALSISTKEDRKFPKTMSPPPSRNNAFIWQIRSQIELGNLAEAGSLIVTLKNDPLFPKRLHDDLEEVQALWFYKQKVWDSAATHLVNALGQAQTKQERARWEFLAAQLYELTGKTDQAAELYSKSIKHTTDPVMDIYARLNLVRINKEGGANYAEKNIEELLKMARRDKYSEYRDVIYYMAAQMEMEQNNFEAARLLLVKASKFNNGNLASKNKSYLLIADLSYDQQKYLQAAAFYDSIRISDLDEQALARVEFRKEALQKLVLHTSIIARQDSLQAIAAMTEDERTVYISKLLKQLLKQQGLDDKTLTSGNAFPSSSSTDLFAGSTKGEWYFYNDNLKTQGQQKFKQSWGNRPNTDNWRRFAEVSQQAGNKVANSVIRDGGSRLENPPPTGDEGPSFTSLLSNVPLNEDALYTSNDSIRQSLMVLGMVYLGEIEDYAAAIKTFENFRTRFPNNANEPEVLFQLYYAYTKAGDATRAADVKKLLLTKYPDSRYATILKTGKDPVAAITGSEEATKAYESVYDLFIEGRFSEALAAKQQADSIYRTTSWQPQLLYIEAVYHIKQRQDSAAKTVLQTLIAQGPTSPMAAKAQTMIDVLNRRQEIENELASLQIIRPVEDTVAQTPVINQPPIQQEIVRSPVKKDSIITQQQNNPVTINKPITRAPSDSAAKKPVLENKPASIYRFEPASKHTAIVVLDKVDGMFVGEVKNAFTRYHKEKYYGTQLDAGLVTMDDDRKLLVVSGFATAQDAIDYVVRAKKIVHLEIIPWLKSDKYFLSIISESNLPLLLEKKDLQQYRQFLDQNLPGKF